MAGLTAVSRGTGFLRTVVVTNVLGVTYLANTYQSANSVPNLLFELFAAGALQAVLIPAMVQLREGDPAEQDHVVGAVLGLVLVVLAALAVVGAVLARPLMGWLTQDVADVAVRNQEIRLGAVMLWIFLPQVVLYAANVVSTAALNAHHRFAVPAVAPVINNVVVIAAYLWFGHLLGGAQPGLQLTTLQLWVLAGGTTLGVALFCSLPILAARRHVRLRPNLDLKHPRVRSMLRDGAWAAVSLSATQVLLVAMLQSVNRLEGGVAIQQLAWVLFLLPHSVLAVPVLTTRFPALAAAVHRRDWRGFDAVLAGGIRSIGFVALLASGALIASAPAVARIVVHGHATASREAIATATAAFAPGLVGFGLLLFLTRAAYALGEVRPATLATLATVGVGAVLLWVVAGRVERSHVVSGVAVVHSITMLVGAGVLWWLVRVARQRHGDAVDPALSARSELAVGRSLGASLTAGVLVAVVGRWLVDRVGHGSITTALAATALVGAIAVIAVLVVSPVFGISGPAALRSVGSLDRR
jgi:putative peptidoglycan lipid II flippase